MASSLWLELFILSAIVMLIVSPKTTSQQKCPNTSTFAPNSAFSKNLNATLSSLLSNATLANGFYNTSSGALQGPDTANGLFLCRGDVSPSSCQACVKANSEKIITLCPIQKEAIKWDEECMLRYSNRSIFAKMESAPTVYVGNPNDAANPSLLNETSGDLMGSLVNQAVGPSNFFATDDVNFTTSNRLYDWRNALLVEAMKQ